MDLKTDGAGIFDGGNVGSDDGVDARGFGGIADFPDRFELVVVDNDVERQIGLYPAPAADARDAPQVAQPERAGGA